MAIEKTDAVVLRRTDYSNTSLIVSLFTHERGRVDVIAKGARRGTSDFHGVLDLANHVQILYYKHSHGNIHTLAESFLLNDFPGLREELYRFYGGSHILELISSLTASEDRNTELFDLALSALTALSGSGQPGKTLLIFQTELLRILGYIPVFFECVTCGTDVLSKDRAFFSPLKGGALCERCSRETQTGFPVTGVLLRKLHDLSELSPDHPESTDVTPSEHAELTHILLKYFTFLLDREPRTARFLLDKL